VRSGYVWSKQGTPGFNGEVSTTTDTNLTLKANYYGFNGVQPFASLMVNAPTGKTALFGNAAFARMDSDLVDILTFGEGWNIGPTVGANFPITRDLMFTASVGYTNRGPYTREGAIEPTTGLQGTTRLDPGNNTTYTATLAYDDDRLAVTLTGTYTTETETTLDAAPLYKSGARWRGFFDIEYQWNAAWRSELTASVVHTNSNKVTQTGISDLVYEAFNSNSNVYRVDFETSYKMDRFSIGPTLGYLYRDANSWSSTAFQFLPAKTRWSAGMFAGYKVTPTFSINGRVEHIWIRENENPDKVVTALSVLLPGSGVPTISGDGWLISLGGTVKW